MAQLLRNRWIQLGIGGVGIAVAGVVIGLLIPLGQASSSSTGDLVSLTSGGSVKPRGRTEPGHIFAQQWQTLREDLPVTAAEAVAAGWKDPVLCDPGRGRYFQKDVLGEDLPYLLMYNNEDELIGVYLYLVSDDELPPPWKKWENLVGGGAPIIDYEHWSLLVYFQDLNHACAVHASTSAAQSTELGSAVRSTPTPYVAPTPTPTVGSALQEGAKRMATLKSLSFTLTAEPEGTSLMPDIQERSIQGSVVLPAKVSLQAIDAAGAASEASADSLPFRFEGLAATVASILQALQDPVDAPRKWIDNVPSRGLSGRIKGEQL